VNNMPNLTLNDLKELSKLDVDKAIEYAKNAGVELLDDYDDIIDKIRRESAVIAGNTKMRLLQLLDDVAAEAEDMDAVNVNFAEKAESGGYIGDDNLLAEQIAITSGYNSYGSARYNTMSEKKTSKSAWRFIAEIDGRTTDGCRALNGSVFRFNDNNAFKKLFPPRHYNCRSIAMFLPIWSGKVNYSSEFPLFYADKQFWKSGKGYNFFPSGRGFNKSLYNAFIAEMDKRGIEQ